MSGQADATTNTLVKALSGASFGLGVCEPGVCELVGPGKVAAIAGVDDTSRSRRVIRTPGVRECGHGAALLSGPARLVWTRVAGDVLDHAARRTTGNGARGAPPLRAL